MLKWQSFIHDSKRNSEKHFHGCLYMDVYSCRLGYRIEKIPDSKFNISQEASHQVAQSIASRWNSAVVDLKSLCRGNDWMLFLKVMALYICLVIFCFCGLQFDQENTYMILAGWLAGLVARILDPTTWSLCQLIIIMLDHLSLELSLNQPIGRFVRYLRF